MSETRRRSPKYGDEVFVPSHHPDGHWTNGIVNSIAADGKLLIAAPGHRMSNLVLARLSHYGSDWCWPEDVNAPRSSGPPKRVLLEDLEG